MVCNIKLRGVQKVANKADKAKFKGTMAKWPVYK